MDCAPTRNADYRAFLEAAETEASTPTLFDLLDAERLPAAGAA